jgi:predicted N-acetyltransferase YhbS
MQIRVLTEADLAPADELRRVAGWNQTINNWRLLLSFEPQGCFVAVEDDRVLGTVTTTTYGRELAWIGMMLVHPDHRRRGIGTQLMGAALDHLRGRGIECIRLDATPAGLPVYEKLGFVSEWTLTRHQVTAVPSTRASEVCDLVEDHWPAVEQLDAVAFGVSRARVLRSLTEGSRSTLVWLADRTIEGYGMLRPGSHCDYLGPLVCARSESAHSLIAALLNNSAGRRVFWDVPDDNDLAKALVQRLEFQAVRPLTRMRLGPDRVRSDPDVQLGIVDPSLG